MSTPQFVAHRGLMAHYPENTLEGLEAAIRLGAQYVEFDLQSLADGTLVLFHDTELSRITGRSGNLFELSWPELKAFRAQAPHDSPHSPASAAIPSLAELVSLLSSYPKVEAFVEIKQQSLERFGLESVMPSLLETLQPVAARSIIISYQIEALTYARAERGCRIGWIFNRYHESNHLLAERLRPEFLICEHSLIPRDQPPWEGPWKWMVYDIMDPDLAQAYAARGIELIETGDITRLEKARIFHPASQK